MSYHIEDGMISVVFKQGINEPEAMETVSRLGCTASVLARSPMRVVVGVPQGEEVKFAERFFQEPNVEIAATIHKQQQS